MTASRAKVFSVTAAIAYTLAFYSDLPLFSYAIEIGTFAWRSDRTPGPHIYWYGWLATSCLAGLVAAVLIPPRFAARLPHDYVWLLSVVLIAATFLYEKRWFFEL